MRVTSLRLPTAVLLTGLTVACTDQPSAPILEPEPSFDLVAARLPSVEDRARSLIVTGPSSAAGPHVKVFDGSGSSLLASFFAYTPSFTGGVRVATGDVDGDGLTDYVTGAGPGAGPHVKVFSGTTGAELRTFFAFDPGFTGGVFVAAGDVDGDGHADIVTGAGSGGGPHVKVFSGATGAELRSFFAFDPGFTGGVRVAAGDVNRDGHADIITGAGPGGAPHVRVFDGATGDALTSFFAFTPGFSGGVFVATGDVSGDGHFDIIAGAGPGGGPGVKVFSGATGGELSSFLAYAATFTGGVSVAAADVDGDGRADVVTGAGSGGAPHVKVFSGATGAELASFLAYAADFAGGVFVAAGARGSLSADDLAAAANLAAGDQTLVGEGDGASAAGRLAAWLNMLGEAAALIESGDVAAACGQLEQAYLRADGASPPSDFVTGPARDTLADMILALMDELGCGAV
jgi:hypothetical protein